jgi:hypothetical protein
MPRIRLALAAAGLIALPAAAQRAPTVRDSAGIRIVTNATAAVPARRLEPRPILSLGEDESGTTFGSVAGAVRLSDGSVVVADGKANELRLFDAAGRLVRPIGRRGAGPGDFRWIAGLWRLAGDTVLVWDGVLNRLTRFDPTGQLGRTTTVSELPLIKGTGQFSARSTLSILGVLANGTLLGSFTNARFNPTTGVYSDTLSIIQVTPPDGFLPVVSLVTGESYVFHAPATEMTSVDPMPFTAKDRVRTAATSLWRTDRRRFELREYAPSGAVRTIVRLTRTPTPVTAGEVAAFRSALVATALTETLNDPSDRPRMLKHAELTGAWLPFPATHPAFTGLVVASTGEVWAREHGDSTKAQRWHLFTPTGALTATIEMPAGVEPLDIGRDYLLAKFRNEDDVESVRVYRFAR